ncbi:hypothetical protein KP509_38G036000 [Ceratopteris richardii]|uniref:Uncharacterized protein n=1 Tax=Ceratopteris richardii TaxID=49495 RepID=A0A8T2Q2Z0_CERRI|nr:hypothetical protein KP509_38G036000 [Ceratopteris richardii]
MCFCLFPRSVIREKPDAFISPSDPHILLCPGFFAAAYHHSVFSDFCFVQVDMDHHHRGLGDYRSHEEEEGYERSSSHFPHRPPPPPFPSEESEFGGRPCEERREEYGGGFPPRHDRYSEGDERRREEYGGRSPPRHERYSKGHEGRREEHGSGFPPKHERYSEGDEERREEYGGGFPPRHERYSEGDEERKGGYEGGFPPRHERYSEGDEERKDEYGGGFSSKHEQYSEGERVGVGEEGAAKYGREEDHRPTEGRSHFPHMPGFHRSSHNEECPGEGETVTSEVAAPPHHEASSHSFMHFGFHRDKHHSDEDPKEKASPEESSITGKMHGLSLDLPEGRLVRIVCKGNSDYHLTVEHSSVEMQEGKDDNESQIWIKDVSHGVRVKDKYGYPAFTLVNKKTGKMLKHSNEEGQQVCS